MALAFRDGPLPQRSVERGFHRVLERARVTGGERVAGGVAPLVHVEAVDVVAGNAPLGEEVDDPAIHAHRADRQDQRQLLAGVAASLYGKRDLVPHQGLQVGERLADHRLKILVPARLPRREASRIGIDARIDLFEVPAGGQKALHQRSGNR